MHVTNMWTNLMETKSKTRKCVIIGGGFSGLVFARVLSPHFDEVTIVERDTLNDNAEHRKGVPQGTQIHALLRRGLIGMENLFPGFMDELVSLGAVQTNASRDWWSLFQGGLLPTFDSDLEFPNASRPLIEQLVLSRVRLIENLRIADNTRVVNVTLSGSQSPVVELEDSKGQHIKLRPDVCVDASGGNSNIDEWLSNSGFSAPKRWVTKPRVGYCTFRIRNPVLPEGKKAP